MATNTYISRLNSWNSVRNLLFAMVSVTYLLNAIYRDIWRARPVALPLSSWHLLHVHVHPHSRQKAQILARPPLKNALEAFLHFYQERELVHYCYKPFVYRGLQFWTQGRNPNLLNSDFKGTVSGDGYFFEGLNILISTFCVYDDGFQGLSKAFTALYNY